MSINEKIGRNIRKAREKAGLTLQQVGDHFDYTAQAVETWESGKRAVSAEKLVKLAQLLKVQTSSLLGERSDV